MTVAQVFAETPPGISGAVDGSPVRQVRELVTEFVDRPGFRFTDAEVLAQLREWTEVAAVVEAARLVLIAELGARPEALASVGRAGRGSRGGRVVRFLTEGLRESRGRA